MMLLYVVYFVRGIETSKKVLLVLGLWFLGWEFGFGRLGLSIFEMVIFFSKCLRFHFGMVVW